MKILALTTPQTGVGYHRILMPITYLLQNRPNDYAKVTNSLTEEELEKGYDVVFMNRALDMDASVMLELKKKYGFRLVVDNDDHWLLDAHHVLYQHYKTYGISQKIIDYIQIADSCTCTHERLADHIRKFNKKVFILPNAIPYGDGQFNEFRSDDDLVRLFWAGSDTHAQDLDILRYPIRRVWSDGNLRNKIKMVMSGYWEGSKPVWDVMVSAFTSSLRLPTQIYNFNSVENYMNAASDSDIHIIPLLETSFNGMKSNLKVLEAAAKKVPVICSDVHPYKDMPINYVGSVSWYQHIKDLVNDEAMRKERGQELFDWCNKHYNFAEINELRYKILS